MSFLRTLPALGTFAFAWILPAFAEPAPAVGGQHRPGVGGIPTKQLINIKQVVLPDVMSVAVDGHERTRWQADFRGVNEPIAVRGTHGATVQLRQVLVRKLR